MLTTHKLFLTMWLAGTLSVLAVLPYAFNLQQEILQSVPLSLPVLALISLLQSAVLIAITTYLGLSFAKKVGFTFPVLELILSPNGNVIQWKSFLRLPITLGIITALTIIFGDYLFKLVGVSIDVSIIDIPLWKRLLASFYGGITEEILLRLFLVSVLVWVFGKLTRSVTPISRRGLVWSAIIISSILFGIGHLPATSTITGLTSLVIARAVILNGIGGLVFGWLYWKKGFEEAVVAHFIADIMLLVVFPLLLSLI